MSTGGGHGNFYLLLPAASWMFVLAAILLFGYLDDWRVRLLFSLVMLFHYLVLTGFLAGYSFAEDAAWARYNHIPYVPIAWYLVGQVIIWLAFFSETTGKSKE